MKWEKWATYANNESNWQNRQEKGLLKAEYVKDYVLRSEKVPDEIFDKFTKL
jgi:hypothetical protein